MIRTIFARFGAAAAALLSCACLPTLALASDGGLGFGSSTDPTPSSGTGGTLLVSTAAILGRTLRVQGTMAHGQAGAGVLVERQERDGTWVPTATATTTAGGAFTASWRTDHIGRFPLRALPAAVAGASAAAVAAVPSTGTTPVTVYRPSIATYFGPGFFGHKTACGQILAPDTLGVAHRSLPCGSMVALYYRGRSITVPVVDRGPFRAGTTWDLTSATAQALRLTATGRIGALRLPQAAPVAAAG